MSPESKVNLISDISSLYFFLSELYIVSPIEDDAPFKSELSGTRRHSLSS